MLRLENLTKSYRIGSGVHYLFRDITLDFPEQANVGILGPNGSGKSTLLRIIGGIDFPDSGKVVCDKSISWPLGISGGFLGHLTGRENCDLICRLYGLSKDKQEDTLDRIKELSGLGKFFEEPITYYSTGMNGRLNFSLSMAFDFEYLLIDELTSVGDRHFRDKAREALDKKRSSCNVIMVSHSAAIVRDFCEHGILLKDGQMQVFDSLDDALRAYFPAADIPKSATLETSHSSVEQVLALSVDKEDDPNLSLKRRLDLLLQELHEQINQADRIEDEAVVCHRLGVLLFQLGSWNDALDFHQKAVYLDEQNLAFYPPYLNCLFQLGKLEESMQILDEVLKWSPDHAALVSQRGTLLQRLGRNLEAQEMFEHAALLEPKNADRHYQLATVQFIMGNFDPALKSILRAIEIQPSVAPFFELLSRILAELNRWEESVEAKLKYGDLVKKKPPPPKDWNQLYQGIVLEVGKAIRNVK